MPVVCLGEHPSKSHAVLLTKLECSLKTTVKKTTTHPPIMALKKEKEKKF